MVISTMPSPVSVQCTFIDVASEISLATSGCDSCSGIGLRGTEGFHSGCSATAQRCSAGVRSGDC